MQKPLNSGNTAQEQKEREQINRGKIALAERFQQAVVEFELVDFSENTAELLAIYTQQRNVCKRLQRFVEATRDNKSWQQTDINSFVDCCRLPLQLIADIATNFVYLDAVKSEIRNDERAEG